MIKNKIKIAVLFGGNSNEHDVSVASAEQVIRNLDNLKYMVKPVFISAQGKWFIPEQCIVPPSTFSINEWINSIESKNCSFRITDIKNEIDLAFILLHGKYGEDGIVQGFLDLIGLKYTGSGVLASSLAFNKTMAKQIFLQNKIKTPEYVVLNNIQWQTESGRILMEVEERLGYPCIIKPSESGSSVDIGFCRSDTKFKTLVDNILSKYNEVIIEEYIEGNEYSCGVLKTEGKIFALPPTQIIPKKAEYFDYASKYEANATEEITPAEASSEIIANIKLLGIQSHNALGCKGYSRTDMKCKGDTIYVLETNTLPGMTKASLLPKQAAVEGISYSRLLDIIIKGSL